jgi:hypothetical protein
MVVEESPPLVGTEVVDLHADVILCLNVDQRAALIEVCERIEENREVNVNSEGEPNLRNENTWTTAKQATSTKPYFSRWLIALASISSPGYPPDASEQIPAEVSACALDCTAREIREARELRSEKSPSRVRLMRHANRASSQALQRRSVGYQLRP